MADPLALTDLRLRPAELYAHVLERVTAGDALDAFLLGAGMLQVAEDVLERDPLRLADAQRVLDDPFARIARGAAAVHALTRMRHRSIAPWAERLAVLVEELAAAALGTGRLPRPGTVAGAIGDIPTDEGLLSAVTRPPTCFRDLDQHPDDLRELARRIAARRPPLPVVVAGVRTSGSYLAPLLAAALRAEGMAATALTLRPYVRPGRAKLRRLREAATVVVTDDPPSSGGSIGAVADLAGRGGARVLLALQMLADAPELPARLERYETVLLPWEEWALHRRLDPGAVQQTLQKVAGEPIAAVERVPDPSPAGRSHHRARFRVHTPDRPARDVIAEGAGLGYLGAHALAVEGRMGEWVQPALGVVDGLAFREELAGEPPTAEPALAEAVAGYAAARRTRLPATDDASVGLAGQDPVWEVAANQLAAVFGRAWRPLRLLAVDRLCRDLLVADTPSVVDGRMSPRSWRLAGNRLVKLDAAERDYSSRNLASADAAFDVAGAAVAWPAIADELREAFARRAGEEVDEERWLVLRLVAIWAAERDGELDRAEARRAQAHVFQDYFAALYFADLPPGADGPACALDIDGVLETEALGVSTLSPASARALRALRAHGYRVVLASGRSAPEVADRVRAYGLAGGVAEYGGALVDERGRVCSLLSEAAQLGVDRARGALDALPGVEVEPAYRVSVRAWQRDDHGVRRALAAAAETAALDAGGALRAVRGDDQTDFVPAGVDKGTGLDRLLAGPLAFAVGDTAEDRPMLALADMAAVPGHARHLRDGHVQAMRRPYQAGLEQAVGKLIGHAPGGCPACALPAPTRERRLLLRALAAPERGRVGMALSAAGLVAGVRR